MSGYCLMGRIWSLEGQRLVWGLRGLGKGRLWQVGAVGVKMGTWTAARELVGGINAAMAWGLAELFTSQPQRKLVPRDISWSRVEQGSCSTCSFSFWSLEVGKQEGQSCSSLMSGRRKKEKQGRVQTMGGIRKVVPTNRLLFVLCGSLQQEHSPWSPDTWVPWACLTLWSTLLLPFWPSVFKLWLEKRFNRTIGCKW